MSTAGSLMPSHSLSGRLARAYPTEIGRIVRVVSHAYSAAHQRTMEEYPEQIAHDLIPYERRAIIERDVQAAMRVLGHSASSFANVTRNSFHTEIVMAARGGLPALHVLLMTGKSSQRVPRESQFRNAVFRRNQGDLFESAPSAQLPKMVHALVTHVPAWGRPAELSGVWFGVPDASGKRYVDSTVDLIRLTLELEAASAHRAPTVKDEAKPRFLPGESDDAQDDAAEA